jgi:hypothetical protein
MCLIVRKEEGGLRKGRRKEGKRRRKEGRIGSNVPDSTEGRRGFKEGKKEGRKKKKKGRKDRVECA